MKTIVSLALAGLMSISALLPALAAQEAENVSIPKTPAFRKVWRRMRAAYPVPAAQRMRVLRRSPAAMQGLMFRNPNPTVCQ